MVSPSSLLLFFLPLSFTSYLPTFTFPYLSFFCPYSNSSHPTFIWSIFLTSSNTLLHTSFPSFLSTFPSILIYFYYQSNPSHYHFFAKHSLFLKSFCLARIPTTTTQYDTIWYTSLHHITSCHVMSCHVMSRHIMSLHTRLPQIQRKKITKWNQFNHCHFSRRQPSFRETRVHELWKAGRWLCLNVNKYFVDYTFESTNTHTHIHTLENRYNRILTHTRTNTHTYTEIEQLLSFRCRTLEHTHTMKKHTHTLANAYAP